MMRLCVFCRTRYQKGSGITFHKFPTDSTKQLWQKNMKMKNWSPKPNDRLCSKHFTKDCFIKHTSRTSLKNDSVPTIFFEASSSAAEVIRELSSIDRDYTNLDDAGKSAAGVKRELSSTDHEYINRDEASTTVAGVKRELSSTDHEYIDLDEASTSAAGVKRELSSTDHEYINLDEASTSVAGVKRELSSTDHEYINRDETSTIAAVKIEPSSIDPLYLDEASEGAARVKSESIDQEYTNLDEASTSESQKKSRTISEVCDNVKHDHHYENTPSRSDSEDSNTSHDIGYKSSSRFTNKTIQRLKKSLNMSRARVKVLSQHVKRLKMTVSSLKTVITDLKKKRN